MKRRVTLMFGSLVVLGLVTGGRSEAAMGQLVTQVTVGGPFLANVTAVSGDGSRLAGDGVIVDVDTGSATYAFGSTVLALDGTGQKALLLVPGTTSPNLVIARVGVGYKVCLFTQSGTHLIADIAGVLPKPG